MEVLDVKREIKSRSDENAVRAFLVKYCKELLYTAILLLGIFLRIYQFAEVPAGFNQDEASIGYDAWSILHYGIDRNGTQLPVHLIAWGSGQNALYAYFSMPFIAVMGLNVASVRMVNFIFGVLSIMLVYSVLKKLNGERTAYIGMFLMAIVPWHIMLSRWGLESNLFPGMFLLGFYFLLKGLECYKWLPLAAFIFALSMYSYGAAYVVVPLFCLFAFVYMIVKAKVSWEYLCISIAVFIITAIPIAMFVLTNLFHWGDIKILMFTAPEMTGVTRLSTATAEHDFVTSLEYFWENVILQKDRQNSNYVENYGILYQISMPFVLLGVCKVHTMRKQDKSKAMWLLISWLLCGSVLFFIYAWTNINRVNIIFIPMILLAAFGIDYVCTDYKKLLAVAMTYVIFLTGFLGTYFGEYSETIAYQFRESFGDAIVTAIEQAEEDEPIYVSAATGCAYIYTLFYGQISPEKYVDTVEIENMDVEFQSVNSFDRFCFSWEKFYEMDRGVYVVSNSCQEEWKEGAEVLASYKNFSVLRIK